MNKANLKSYAPKARLDFIKAVTERANVLGISAAGALPAEVRGDVAIIDGREWSAKVAGQREELLSRIKRHGFEQTMDEVAYTWFNRFAALRYMEIHDYLDHGWRVLSSRDGGLPEILRHASEVSLPGLNADRAREMQLAGNQDNELYKLLLVAQCNELSRVMPFLFERIDDDTELLLPENLLRTDSIVAKLVESVPEEDWQEIEVIGWLYQFYISEKKDQVIGKVVKSEDIPAATQLFTPNWIVQYLVQNSVGRLWLMANPTSTLASQWPYYIQPAEQTPEVQAQLDALIQTRVREDGETLNPETITVLDPACGSGHILVVAYDVLKAIYLERGYQPRTIPRLILEKNLYGLDIDDRAAQLAAFALLMKARADDRRLFADPPKLNVMSLQSSAGLNCEEICIHLALFGLQRHTIWGLIEAFEHAKTFGSLIQIPYQLQTQLEPLAQVLVMVMEQGDMYAQQAARDLRPLVQQALLLGSQFDAVVANPPYMGVKGMEAGLKAFCKKNFFDSKTDLFAVFIERSIASAKSGGFASLVTMHAWMFLSTFEQLRKKLTREFSIDSLLHIGPRGFDSIGGEVVQAAAFCFQKSALSRRKGVFLKLTEGRSEVEKIAAFREAAKGVGLHHRYLVDAMEFDALPGSPIAYWASGDFRRAFRENDGLDGAVLFRQGMSTTDAERFERLWHEVSLQLFVTDRCTPFVETDPSGHWYPFNKGGSRRKWYGNFDTVVRYENNGQQLLDLVEAKYPNISDPEFVIKNRKSFFQSAITYASIGTGDFSARFVPNGFAYSVAGPAIFANDWDKRLLLALLCSNATSYFLRAINPTLGFQIADVGKIPFSEKVRADVERFAIPLCEKAISIAKTDWDEYEGSWDFRRPSFLNNGGDSILKSSWSKWVDEQVGRRAALRQIEEENNRLFISAYGLQNELAPDVLESQITLACADREKDCQRLISYAIGCMMGRYSLDEPGLIYAHAGNVGFEPNRYEKKFPADADGIVPLTDEPWFTDDAARRVRDFLRAVWGPDTLEENMVWLAESLGVKGGETPEETIRRYLADKFFKDHLQSYKKRPIYWLFSSGKQGAFQALVYLHRYNEGTLARMRAEYVVPLIAKMVSRLEMLNQDVAAASSAAARTKLQKQIESLRKKQLELLAYDEKLRHYADMRILLDLDDGVKVNYAKFGDLVAESKAITGGSDE